MFDQVDWHHSSLDDIEFSWITFPISKILKIQKTEMKYRSNSFQSVYITRFTTELIRMFLMQNLCVRERERERENKFDQVNIF